jgi:hypothetical protein
MSLNCIVRLESGFFEMPYCYFVDKYTLWWLGCFLRDTFLQMDLMYLEAKFGVSILAT